MSQSQKPGSRIARRLGLGLVMAAVLLFVRSTGILPDRTIAQAPTPDIMPAQAPIQAQPSETSVPAFAPTREPAGPGGVVLVDVTAEPPTATQAENTPAPQPEGVWAYEDDGISVRIQRVEQDDFVYFAAEVRLASPSQFSYAFSNEKYGAHTEALSDIAARHDPLLAINGDYYSFHNNGIIIRGGELFRKNKSSRHLLVVDKNGDLSVLTDRSEKQSVVADRLMKEGALHAFEFGPELVRDGQAVKLNSAILRVGKGYLEPRTAIGQIGLLHYLIIVVDGRSEGYSKGCDLPALQQLFVQHGAQVAFNLDGGGSTTLWFDGEIINHPSAGDERKVSDIIMFMRK